MTKTQSSASWIDRPRPLRYLLAPFVVALTAALIADATWPALATERPLLLITLNPKNRFLLLVAPQVGAVAFFVVGFLRLVFTDPVTYMLGRQYGEEAVTWIERKTGGRESGGGFVRKAERLFGKAAPLFILVAPSALWCVLAGSSRMRVSVFVTCNVVGTIGRLVLFWYVADAAKDELESILDVIARVQAPLLIVTASLVGFQVIRRRRGLHRNPRSRVMT